MNIEDCHKDFARTVLAHAIREASDHRSASEAYRRAEVERYVDSPVAELVEDVLGITVEEQYEQLLDLLDSTPEQVYVRFSAVAAASGRTERQAELFAKQATRSPSKYCGDKGVGIGL